METRSDHLTVPRKWLRHGVLLVLVFSAIISLVAASRAPTEPVGISGWLVVEKSATGDDTATIQAAIDSVARSG